MIRQSTGFMIFLALLVIIGNPQVISVAHAESAEREAAMVKNKDQKIRLSINGKEAIVILDNNSASKSFAAMMPLTLTFEDYNGTEKISYLPKKLDIANAPTSCEPKPGSFTYYAPWGNLAIFYRGFRRSEGLVPLGHFESGLELLAGQKGNFSVTIEIAD